MGSSLASMKSSKLTTPETLAYIQLPKKHTGNFYLNVAIQNKAKSNLVPSITVVGGKQIKLKPIDMKAGLLADSFLIAAKDIKGATALSVTFYFSDKKKIFQTPVQMKLTIKKSPIKFNTGLHGTYVSMIWIHKGKYYAANQYAKNVGFNVTQQMDVRDYTTMELNNGKPGSIDYISLKGSKKGKNVYLQMAFKHPTTKLLTARYDLCPTQNVAGCKLYHVGPKTGSLGFNSTITPKQLKGFSYIRVQAMIGSYSKSKENDMEFIANNQKVNYQYKNSLLTNLSILCLSTLLAVILQF